MEIWLIRNEDSKIIIKLKMSISDISFFEIFLAILRDVFLKMIKIEEIDKGDAQYMNIE